MKEKKPTKEGQSISALLADSSDIPQITSNWRNKIRKKKMKSYTNKEKQLQGTFVR